MSLRRIPRRVGAIAAGLLTALAVAAAPAAAHPHPHPHTHDSLVGSALDGFVHPFIGLDHLAAMLAVGAIAALAHPRRPVWAAPAAFVGAMIVGGAIGFGGIEIAGVEGVIAASVLVAGAILLAARRAPLGWWLLPLVALAGAAHGNAHGLEAPEAAVPVAYVIGFVLATGALHAAGAVIGVAMRRVDLGRIVAGTLLAVLGATLVFGT